MNKLKAFRSVMDKISIVLEIVLSAFLIVAIVFAIFFLKTPFLDYIAHSADTEALITFMTYILNIVIGVELFKMLCSPGTETVLEVMMFVVVRHMIVHDTTAVENLLTIIGVVIIVLVKKYLHEGRLPKKKEEDDSEAAQRE